MPTKKKFKQLIFGSYIMLMAAESCLYKWTENGSGFSGKAFAYGLSLLLFSVLTLFAAIKIHKTINQLDLQE